MKFKENLKEARKQLGYSQEELADKLMVSRQAVSKWEQGSAYPELDKLLQLCELFHCTLDDLLKGDIKERSGVSKESYDAQETWKAKGVTAGIGCILAGLCAYCFLEPTMKEDMLDIVFLLFVIIGIVILVFFGMQSAAYRRKYPQTPQDIYTEKEMDAFHRRFSIAVTVGVGLILFGMLCERLLESRMHDSYANGVFLAMVTVAVTIFVYFGLRKEAYERTCALHQSEEEKDELVSKWCACIMMTATAIFLFVSFLWNVWDISWIVFPIGGILCGIISVIFSKGK